MKASCIPALALLFAGAFTCAAIFAQAPVAQSDKEALPSLPSLRQVGNGQHSVLWGQQNGWNLREQSRQLAAQYAKSEKEEEKKEIRKKLSEVLAKQFDAQVKQQEKELADLERQITSLKELLKKRQNAKTTIIDRRMEQLIQDAEGLGWTAPSAPSTFGGGFGGGSGGEFIRSGRPSQ